MSRLSSSAWAEQDSSCRAGCANHSGNLVASVRHSCPMRQSLVVCTWVLQWVQETICWCFPFPVWEYGLSSIPAPSRHGKQHKTNRPYFKYSLLGKTHYPFGWSLIFHHWNLHWVLIKYLNVLHHLTKAARKVVFSLCAYCAPIIKTHYPGTQPAAEQKPWFCSAGQDNSKMWHKAQASQYSCGAGVQSLYPTEGSVSVLLLVE